MLFLESFIKAGSACRSGRSNVISRPGRSQVGPLFDGGDFLCSQLSPDRHLQALEPDGFREEAQTGVTWHNGGAAAAAFEKRLAGIDTQRRELLRLPVTRHALLRKQGPDFLLEEFDRPRVP